MPVTTQRVLDYLQVEWPAYVPGIRAASPEKQTEFLKAQGYARLADLIAHIAVWWEEAYGIILATVEGREFERKKYDFDQFNAAAVARFKDNSEEEVLAFFEEYRRKFLGFHRDYPTAAEEHRRVASWFYAVVIHHAAEHSFAASRFLTLDWLTNDWAEYVEDFKNLPAERQQKFLEKQGFARFRDIVAHVIAWFNETHDVIVEIAKDPAYKYPSRDVDAYNAEVVAKYGTMSEQEVWDAFEASRLQLVELVTGLSDKTLRHPDVQDWLKSDVIGHYFDHQF